MVMIAHARGDILMIRMAGAKRLIPKRSAHNMNNMIIRQSFATVERAICALMASAEEFRNVSILINTGMDNNASAGMDTNIT